MGDDKNSAKYGVDAPSAVFGLVVGALVMIAWAVTLTVWSTWWAAVAWLFAAVTTVGAASFLYTTRVGKFVVWEQLLDAATLHGNETVLDAGCGRGAVLAAVAKRLPHGRVVGVDLWRKVDQSGNDIDATTANVRAEGVADRVELVTADLQDLPYGPHEFDLVVSGLVVHNIKDATRRAEVITELARVLKPGARVIIADISHVDSYARTLNALHFTDIAVTPSSWRYWYSPWMRTKVLTASKPTL